MRGQKILKSLGFFSVVVIKEYFQNKATFSVLLAPEPNLKKNYVKGSNTFLVKGRAQSTCVEKAFSPMILHAKPNLAI